jgi:hypothetical protein
MKEVLLSQEGQKPRSSTSNADHPMPETKELKRRVRDIIDPSRHLGHVDSHVKKPASETPSQQGPSGNQLPLRDSTVPVGAAASSTPPVSRAEDALQEVKGDGERDGHGDELRSAKTVVGDEKDVEEEGKVVISGGEGVFYCKPGDEDCG